MKPAIFSLAASLLLGAAALTGCAGEDAEAGEAAYPPIGYTPPAGAVAAEPPARPPPPAAPPPEAQSAQPASPPGAWQWAPPADDAAGDGAAGANASPGDDGAGYDDGDPAALSDFRSTLDPYGSWTDDPTYGTVWVPSSSVVGSDFTPYVSAGHWAYDSDYAWVSDYDWGWAPFHYGRWVYAAGPGWEWIPGRAYAGAWVSWRYGVDDWAYVGWAPLAPTWCWRGGVAVGLGYVPRAPYAFVGNGELFAPRVGASVVVGAQVGSIASHTRPYVSASPSVGGRVAAQPMVGGPSPASLHIAPDAVARVTADNRGLTQARAFSRPSTAMALGARAPEGVAARAAPAAFSRGGASVPAYRSSALASSHFGGRRLGGGFAGSASASAPMRSPSPSYSGGARPYFGPTSSSPMASARSSSPAYRSYSAPSAMRSSPSSGAFRSAPSASSFHGGGGYSGGFHGGGGYHGGGGGHSGGHR